MQSASTTALGASLSAEPELAVVGLHTSMPWTPDRKLSVRR